MLRVIHVQTIVLALSVILGTESQAQFIPKKPSDIIPKKPEDILPKLPPLPKKPEDVLPKPPSIPQNETQFAGRTKTSFRYTILNETGTTVRFRLPSGQVYTLQDGTKGSYTFKGHKPDAKIHVFNTGKTYQLEGGDHKLWWMKKEARIGFDLDYKE